MKHDNNFYYHILNIHQNNNINNLIEIRKTILNNKLNIMKNNVLGVGLCKIVAHNISLDLTDLGIKNIILNTKDLLGGYEHVFVIAYYLDNDQLKYILIDPTFNQFIKRDNATLLKRLEAWPSEVLNKSNLGKEIICHLKINGYMVIDNNHIEKYLGSFINVDNLENFDLGKVITKSLINR